MRTMRRAAPIAALAALALALPAPAAEAQESHPFLGVLGAAAYEDACGAAFGPGGLWVADYYHDRISPPSGTAISPADPAGGPCKLAFDSAGDLYVYGYHHDVLAYPSAELVAGKGALIDPNPAEAGAEAPTGLALDRASGDLYVAHRTYIAKYEAPVHAGEAPTRIGTNPAAAYYGIAFSEFPGAGAQPATGGYLYVPDAATRTVAVFDPATSTSAPIESMRGEATPQGGFRDLRDSEAIVDDSSASPSYGHLYVLDKIGTSSAGQPEGVFDEFNSAGDYRGHKVEAGKEAVAGFIDAEPSGIAIEAASGNVLVTSGNSEGSAVFKYGPTASARTLKVTRSGAGGGEVTSSPNGIACGSEACAAEFTEGERVTLYAHPDGRSALAGWSVAGAEPCPGTGTCTLLMSANVEVGAEFEEPAQQTLSVTLSGVGQGTLTSDPTGISCPSTCTEGFAQGRAVALSATPAPHSAFAGWSGACTGGESTCRVTMSAAKAVGAEFVPIPPQTLSVSLGGSGEGLVQSSPAGISCPPACSASFDEGSRVTLAQIASPGSAFAGWSGAGCAGSAATCTVTMSEAQALGASFESSLAAQGGSQTARAAALSLARPRGTARASATQTILQKGDLRLTVSAQVHPRALPRRGTAPISVSLASHVTTTDETQPPQLRRLKIEINRHGRLDLAGLPICKVSRIQPASNTRALAACRASLVGRGRFFGTVTLPGASPYPISGRLLVFNGAEGRRPVLLGHIFTLRPFPISFVMTFQIRTRPHGQFGTALSANLRKALGARRNLTGIVMTLSRRFRSGGRSHSFLSAGCPAPRGFPSAVFPLARASFAFAGGRKLVQTLTSNCWAR